MNESPVPTLPPRFRYPLALLAGIALALAFPGFDIAGLAWIAPGLMLAAALGTSGRQAFRLGFVAGLVFWLMCLSWLLNIPEKGFPILGWIALAAYCALFQATWVWLSWKLFPLEHGRAGSPLPAAGARTDERRAEDCAPYQTSFAACSPLARLRWTIVCAALWVALEMIRCRLLSGFPWSLLASSQFELTPLLQISSVTGVFGVSFLIVWASVSLFSAAVVLCSRRREEAGTPGQPQPIRPPRYLGCYAALLPLLVVEIGRAHV